MTASPWTDGLLAEATYLVIEMKFSARATANILNDKYGTIFTKNALIGKLARAGVKRSPQPPKPRAKRIRKPKQVSTKGRGPMPPLPWTPRVVDVTPLKLPLMQLDEDQCRFECSGQDIQTDDIGGFLFCGYPVKPGSAFCYHHHALCWTPAKPEKRAPRRAA